MQHGNPKTITNYAKYCINARDPIIWNSFLSETEKNILSQQFFKCKIKEKIFEFEEEFKFLLNIDRKLSNT